MNDQAQAAAPAIPRITPNGRRKIIILAIVSSALAFLSFFTPVNSQQRNMRAAQRHIDIIAPRIHADARFRGIELQPYTGSDGCLSVFGDVANASDLEDLKRIIDESKPPVKVFFIVHADEEIDRLNHPAK